MLSTNMIEQLVALSFYQLTVFEQHYCLIVVYCELLCLFYGLFVLYDLLKGNLFGIDIIFLLCVDELLFKWWWEQSFWGSTRTLEEDVTLWYHCMHFGCVYYYDSFMNKAKMKDPELWGYDWVRWTLSHPTSLASTYLGWVGLCLKNYVTCYSHIWLEANKKDVIGRGCSHV
jgi:hypothetical protein